MTILGIDPSVRSTGYAVIEIKGREPKAIAFGRIYNQPKLTQSECLKNIYQKITELTEKYQPKAAAMEGVIYVQNRATAISLGAARGVAMAAIAENKIPIYEYPARSIKKASTGYGKAGKNQVGFMMRVIFKLTQTPDPDAADALAIALTHAQSSQFSKAGKRI